MGYSENFQKLWDKTPDMGELKLPAGYFEITRPLFFQNKTVRINSWGTTCLMWNPDKPDPAAWAVTLGASDDAKRSQKGGSLSNVWILGKNPHTSGGCLRVRNARGWNIDLLVGQSERGLLIDSTDDTYSRNNVFRVRECSGDKVALEIVGAKEQNNCNTFYDGHWGAAEGGTVVRLVDGGARSVFYGPVMENVVDSIVWFEVGRAGSPSAVLFPWLETKSADKPGLIVLREGSYGFRHFSFRKAGWETKDKGSGNQVIGAPTSWPPHW